VFTLRCCEMYGCLPSELEGQDYETVLTHRLIRMAEDKYRVEDAKMNAKLRR
jgi:hypothetical protein